MCPRERRQKPSELEVLQYVMDWKKRKRPPLRQVDVALAIRELNLLGWLDAAPSTDLPVSEELMIA